MYKILSLMILALIVLSGCVGDTFSAHRTPAKEAVRGIIITVAALEDGGSLDNVLNSISGLREVYTNFFLDHQLDCCIRRFAKENWSQVKSELENGTMEQKEVYQAYKRNKHHLKQLKAWQAISVVEGRSASHG